MNLATLGLAALCAASIPAHKLVSFGVPVLAIIAAVLALRGQGRLAAMKMHDAATGRTGFVPFFLFCILALASAFWAPNAGSTIQKSALVMGGLGCLLVLHAFLPRVEAGQLRFLARDAIHGYILGMALLTFEFLSGFYLTGKVAEFYPKLFSSHESWVLFTNDGVTVLPVLFDRTMSMLALIFWPCLLLIGLREGGTAVRRTTGALFIALFAVLIFYSTKETAKLAAVASLAAYALARLAPKLTLRLAAVTWVAIALLIIPIVGGLSSAGLAQSDSVQRSGQARIEIWALAANEAKKEFIAGHGAHSMQFDRKVVFPAEGQFRPVVNEPGYAPIHPHNSFLQVWYDLGLLGAVLFSACGLAILWAISRLPMGLQPELIATVASAGVVLCLAHGLWQEWFLSSMALAAAFSFVAVEGWRRTRPELFVATG